MEAKGGPCAGGGCFCASSGSGAGAPGSDGRNARAGSLLPLAPMLGAGAKQGKLPWDSKWEMLGVFINSPCAGSDIYNLLELVLHWLPSLRELFLSGLSAQWQSTRGEGSNVPSPRGDQTRVFNLMKLTSSLLAEEKGGVLTFRSIFPWEGRGRTSLPHTRQERALGARPTCACLLPLLLLLLLLVCPEAP